MRQVDIYDLIDCVIRKKLQEELGRDISDRIDAFLYLQLSGNLYQVLSKNIGTEVDKQIQKDLNK